MRLRILAPVATLAFVLAACSNDTALPTEEAQLSGPEALLAADLAATANQIGQRERSTLDLLLRRFYEALRQTDNAAARALLEESRALADSGRAAAQAGDRQAARAYFEAAHELLFDAIVLVLPEANERTAAVVDTIRTRVLARLGDREAPRIRRVLDVTADLRARADSVAAAGDEGKSLAINVRALEILRALHRHLNRPGAPGLPGDQGGNPPPPRPAGFDGPDWRGRPGMPGGLGWPHRP